MSAALLHCGGANVAVEGNGTLLDTLLAACRPWITASFAGPVPPGAWAVSIGTGGTGAAVASRIGAAVRISPAQRLIHVEPPATPDSVRPLVRLLRALMRRQLAADGALFLDAAALAPTVAGGGIALLGGAGAGKTTTLLAVLHRHHGVLVANDDASLHLSGGRVVARGYPRAIEIRREVLPHLGAAASLLTAEADPASPDRALYLTPHRLAATLGTQLAPTAKLSALVLLARGTGRPVLHRLTPEQGAAAVAANLAAADPYEPWLQPHLPASAPRPEQAHRLAQAVPVWRLAQPLTALVESAGLLADLSASPGGLR